MKIMAVFAHPDDEMGCCATLAKHRARGDEVLLVWTTYGENASHFEGKTHDEVKQVREGHGKLVAEILGAQYRFFDFGDTHVKGDRAEALEMARLYAEWKPDAIITWDDWNRHPDHRTTAKLAFDAITLARIPKVVRGHDDRSRRADGQQSGHDTLEAHRKAVTFYQYAPSESPRPLVHVDVSEHLEPAIKIRDFYAEFYGWEWTTEQFRASRATLGQSVGVKYAERFTIQRSQHPPLEYLV
jgi:N-acetylglucosamine malate deacetylase 1